MPWRRGGKGPGRGESSGGLGGCNPGKQWAARLLRWPQGKQPVLAPPARAVPDASREGWPLGAGGQGGLRGAGLPQAPAGSGGCVGGSLRDPPLQARLALPAPPPQSEVGRKRQPSSAKGPSQRVCRVTVLGLSIVGSWGCQPPPPPGPLPGFALPPAARSRPPGGDFPAARGSGILGPLRPQR